jgi:hypothetical protein
MWNRVEFCPRTSLTLTVESYPRGYPRFAAFLDSTHEFSLFRKFGYLRARVLLQKQDQLAELEEKLSALDAEEEIPYYLCTRREDKNSARQALIREIELTLQEYGMYRPTFERLAPGQNLSHSRCCSRCISPPARETTAYGTEYQERCELVRRKQAFGPRRVQDFHQLG